MRMPKTGDAIITLKVHNSTEKSHPIGTVGYVLNVIEYDVIYRLSGTRETWHAQIDNNLFEAIRVLTYDECFEET